MKLKMNNAYPLFGLIGLLAVIYSLRNMGGDEPDDLPIAEARVVGGTRRRKQNKKIKKTRSK